MIFDLLVTAGKSSHATAYEILMKYFEYIASKSAKELRGITHHSTDLKSCSVVLIMCSIRSFFFFFKGK